jgi:endonuclease/exonuclease/phosphatase family metal-dependent hydrolase
MHNNSHRLIGHFCCVRIAPDRAGKLGGIPRHSLMSMLTRRVHGSAAALLLVTTFTLNGCAGSHAVVRNESAELAALVPGVSWFGPQPTQEISAISRWRRSVGPPLVLAPSAQPTSAANHIVLVNWNMHVGGGDLARLFADVRRDAGPDVPIVFTIQEAYRSGVEVPHGLDAGASFASLIRSVRPDGTREEIRSVAGRLGLHAYYVPSMRNGGPLSSDEDRGNAILSTVPLQDLTAIELPFERQRRVAVAATISGRTPRGDAWKIRVVSAHLDNMVGARRLWIAGGEFGRTRQARGLLSALNDQAPLVLAGDLNTWFGFNDSAYRTAARAFPQTRVTDRRPTFHGLLRLDHMFFRLDDGWTASFRRADDAYDSDHYPLIGQIEFGG